MVEKYIPPKKGKDQVLLMMNSLLNLQPLSTKTNISKALQFLNGKSKHKSIVFILSDFIDLDYQHTLRVTAKKHEVIGIQVYDKAEYLLPAIGLLEMEDAETGNTLLIDTATETAKRRWNMQHEEMMDNTKLYFKKAGADLIQIATGEDYVKAFQQFFIRRK